MKSTGRRATTDVRVGTCALSVGNPPNKPKQGWAWVALSEVAQMATGHTPSRNHPEYWGGEIPWMTVSDARWVDGGTIWSTKESINELGIRKSAAVLLPPGTVCLSRTGSIGYAVILGQQMATSQGFVNWICGPELRPRFLQLVFQAENTFLHQISEGVAHTTIYFPEAKAFHVCKPDLALQDLICEHVDLQLSRLDAAVVALKRAQANLKRYRASVLQAAVTGRLVPTEHDLAQAEGRDYETGPQLLTRILAERRRTWSGKGKYIDATTALLDLDSFETALPADTKSGWTMASLEQLTSSHRPICYGILMPKDNVAEGVLYVKVRDIRQDRVLLDQLQRTAPSIAAKYPRSVLKGGDLLLSIRGTYGRVATVPVELEGGNITQDTCRLAIVPPCDPAYVAWYLRSESGQRYFRHVARGVAVKGVNIADVRLMPIPLPPLAEQARIVEEVERRLSVADRLEATLEANLRRATRLRQAILKKAFTFEDAEAPA